MIRRIILSAAALAVSGCTSVDQALIEPQVSAPPSYATDLPPSGLEAEWWLGFDDPLLDQLVRDGLAANLDIDAAANRLAAAEALLKAERADRIPTIDGSAQVGAALSNDDEITATAGLTGLFNPDINGRLAAEVRAAVADYAEAEYLVADQRRIVAAAIAGQYVEFVRTEAQLDLLDQSTGLQEQTLRIVTLRFEAGLAANLDVRRAAADLAQTRARRGLVAIARADALTALAVLLAEPGRDIIVGDGSQIAADCVIHGPVRLGRNVSLNHHVTLEGGGAGVHIGDGSRIAAYCTFYAFNHGVHADRPVREQPVTSKGIHIGKDVWVGARVGIVDGVTLGDHAVVGMGAVVTKDVPPWTIVAGNPARPIGRRPGSPPEHPST